jgi:hypothetical protein
MIPFQSDRSAAPASGPTVADRNGAQGAGRGTAAGPEDERPAEGAASASPSCPACGGRLIEIRAKLVCSRCRTICETCCEGGPG